MKNSATIICFIGLACPLWLGILCTVALNAYAPGFRNAPPTQKEVDQRIRNEYYRTLPKRMKQRYDSLHPK